MIRIVKCIAGYIYINERKEGRKKERKKEKKEYIILHIQWEDSS